jgi:hypothetical protein
LRFSQIFVFWDIMPCSLFKINLCFGGTCLCGKQKGTAAQLVGSHWLSRAGFLRGLFFQPEDGGDMFLLTVSRISTNYSRCTLFLRSCSSLFEVCFTIFYHLCLDFPCGFFLHMFRISHLNATCSARVFLDFIMLEIYALWISSLSISLQSDRNSSILDPGIFLGTLFYIIIC